MAHTPGPWFLQDDGRINAMTPDEVGGKPTVPEMHTIVSCHGPEFVRKPNARLIAASPELLAACKGLLGAVEGWIANPEDRINQARAAIAKAEGNDATS